MNVIIDGYNLIFQCGLQGRTAGSLALEKARNRLISELSTRLDEPTREKTTIVFDANDRPVKEVADEQQINGLHVVYAADHDDADSLIEELIRRHPTPKKLTVVSSDHRLHEAARRRKATAVDSDVWFDRLDRNPRRPTEVVDDGAPAIEDQPPHIDNPFPPGYGEDLLR
jgi:predicted RNA-binding protein with PIN domain